jgi:hypothetical protein
MRKSFYVLTILAFLLSPGLAAWSSASARDSGRSPHTPADVVLYVRPGANGNCISWASACELQAALNEADAGDQIWVQAGVYRPTEDTTRYMTFSLKSGVALYGGFAGAETGREQRNWKTNVTVLSGDIGTPGNYDDNSHNVVTASDVDASAVLDGFTVENGQANGNWPGSVGGGMFNNNSTPTLSNLIFNSNVAFDGGGMYNLNSSPTLSNVIFSSNTAQVGKGGGMYNNNGSPTLTSIRFQNNFAVYEGGGMFSDYSSSPTLTDVTFSGNQASAFGGGMSNANSSPTLLNVTFSGNGAYYGGGIFNSSSNPSLTNCIFWGNSGTQIYNSDSNPVVTCSDIQGGYAGTGNINTDPKFIRNPSPGADGIWGTTDDDYGDLRLGLTSPVIDAGDNTALPPSVITDLADYPRFVDIASVPDTGYGVPPLVDMGAYEAQNIVHLPMIRK